MGVINSMHLRPTLFNSLQAALAVGSFLPTDFQIATEVQRGGTKLQINHAYSSGYFIAQIPNRQTTKNGSQVHDIATGCRPGLVNIEEQGSVVSDAALLEAISQWVSRLEADMRQTPTFRAIQDVEQQIKDLYAKIGLSPEEEEEQLADDDVDSIVAWIKKLEAEMAANLAKHEKDKAALERKIDNLHVQVDALCMIVGSQITKKGAVRAILGRMFDWGSKPENAKLLADATKTITHLLGSGSGHDGHGA